MAENGSDAEGAPALWLSISEVARLRGVKPQSIHEKVVRLVDSGLLQTRPGRGRERLIDVAQFDRAVGETRERVVVREQPDADAAAPAQSAGLTKARTAQAIYQARLLELELAERSGELVPVAHVKEAAAEMGHGVVRVLGMALFRADALLAAAGGNNVVELRRALRQLIHDQRVRCVEEFNKMVAAAAKRDADAGTDAS
jgi:hypothetical protein